MPYQAHNRRHATIKAKGDETTKHWYVNGQDGGPAFKTIMDYTIAQRDILLVRQGRPPWLDHPDAPWLEGLGWVHPSRQPRTTTTARTDSDSDSDEVEEVCERDCSDSKNVTVEMEVNGEEIVASQGLRASSSYTASKSQRPPAPSQVSTAASEVHHFISTSTTSRLASSKTPTPAMYNPYRRSKNRTTQKPQTITIQTHKEEEVETCKSEHSSGSDSDTEGAALPVVTEVPSPSPQPQTTTNPTTSKPQTIALHTKKEEKVETLDNQYRGDTEATSSSLQPHTMSTHINSDEKTETCESQHGSDTKATSQSPQVETITTYTKSVKKVETRQPPHAQRTLVYSILALFLFWYVIETILHSYIGKPSLASPRDSYNPAGPIWGEAIPYLLEKLFGSWRWTAGIGRLPRKMMTVWPGQAMESAYEWALRVSFSETERKAMRMGVPLAAVYDSRYATEVVVNRYIH